MTLLTWILISGVNTQVKSQVSPSGFLTESTGYWRVKRIVFAHNLLIAYLCPPDEAKLFRDTQPQAQQAKVHGLLNGVDVDFFNPKVRFSEEPLVPQVPFY